MIMVMAEHHPDYDFIMNQGSGTKPGKSPFAPSGNSMKQRIIVVAVGAVLLITVASLVMSLLGSAGKAAKADLVLAAQQQAELIRVSKFGVDRARDASTKNLAMTTSVSMQSGQATLIAAMKRQGVSVSPAELAAGKNTRTDAALTNAEQANAFDAAFTEQIKKQLTAYQQTLKRAYDKASDEQLRQVLTQQYDSAGLLIGAEQ
jgi:hypothetical protein